MKHHFYKLTTEPESAHLTYRNHSNGLTAFRYPQNFNNYLGFLTIDDAEKLVKRKKYTQINNFKSRRM